MGGPWKTKVSEKEACSIARAFWDELSPLLQGKARPQSGHFIELATRLSKTGHEERFSQQFHKYGLAADIPVSYIDVGLKAKHPILCVENTLGTLSKHNKLHILFQGNTEGAYEQFWTKWKLLQPQHPVFEIHPNNTGHCIPVAIHCDEGQTLKKKSIMIVQFQPVLGGGTRKRKSGADQPGLNMIGNSLVSRLLWTVMLGRAYGGKHKNKPLLKLMEYLSQELGQAFKHGIDLHVGTKAEKWFLIPIALKGDWPALAKVGTLNRTFSHQSPKDNAAGICHLCNADQFGFKNWHDPTWAKMIAMRTDRKHPWKKEPTIISKLPIYECDKPDFFRVDLFHTLHKGFFGDIAANSIAS